LTLLPARPVRLLRKRRLFEADSGINGGKRSERAFFHSFSATRQTALGDYFVDGITI
jgi:hypothetical protein